MITYFPEIYPDELLYSVFARYREQSGKTIYRCIAEDLFVNPTVKPDIEFMNPLNTEIIEILEKQTSFENIILKHTMFPYYARFLHWEKRKEAYQKMKDMQGNYNNLFSIPKTKNGEKRSLRYCPICAKKDRENYGETYWHRKHQIIGLDVCPEHGCKLAESSLLITSKDTLALVSAEQEYKDIQVIYGTEVEKNLAEYMEKVMNKDIQWENQAELDVFLNQNFSERYRSNRGQQRKMALFHKEFREFYAGFHGGITEEWQIEKVLKGYRKNPLEICQMAFFLGIPADKLINPILKKKSAEEIFDEKVMAMIQGGYGINETARELQVSSRTVRVVCERLNIRNSRMKAPDLEKQQEFQKRIQEERKYWLQAMKKYPEYSYTKLCEILEYRYHLQWLRRNDKEWTDKHWPSVKLFTGQRQDWQKLDKEMLPLVKKVILQLQGKNGERPKKVTEFAVSRILNLPDRRLTLLPQCSQEIAKHCESQEKYWARELIWAVQEVIKQGKPVIYKNIRNLTNMKRSYIAASYPYVCASGNEEVIRFVEELIKKAG